MTRTSVGRLQAENAPRPGLAEVIAVWTGFGLLALAILVTYARLPLDERVVEREQNAAARRAA